LELCSCFVTLPFGSYKKADKREIKDSPKFAYRLLFARGYTPLQKYQYQVIYISLSI
jgi:hypothetical protein